MFTGLVQDIGVVTAVEDNSPDRRICIETDIDLKNVSVGASISCDGCCLTVVDLDEKAFLADVSAETLSKTNIGNWAKGTEVNIEPSLRLGDEMGGHIVSGHVDGQAILKEITPDGESYTLRFEVPDELSQFIAPKGSVALDGISLTVNQVEANEFTVNIIPHSWEKTTISQKEPGNHLNIEIDMLARYAARILQRTAA